ncbi:sensor domain-containing protein [Xanthomonas sp. 3307]|uniref:sensor domain-containing protein n=1 Tax=Xanthomonas sp. 3307 TaxID=3035316 RepID=UPI00160C7C97|nr:sensor domain-containing protein [Xanthomonas sp. 3307]MBB5942648.1 putative membrane protein [Xanthomonas sp. 3307]
MSSAHTAPRPLPTTIPDYLAQLRAALAGADPALVQDALYDAEEYLRSELAEQPGKSEAEVIAGVAGSYGAPDEVAEIYRETEVTVNRALRPPTLPKRRSLSGRFFGVVADPRAYGSLFYMLLSLVTGIFYFTWLVTGISVSAGMLILIVGVPLLVLFFGSVRVLSLVEGRIVEVLLGERMPRRPLYSAPQQPWLRRIGQMFTDARTWTTMLYFLLMLPLGTFYFSVFITLLSIGLALAAAPLGFFLPQQFNAMFVDGNLIESAPWLLPVWSALGIVLLFGTLHLARAVGKLHGLLAKHLLVHSAGQ